MELISTSIHFQNETIIAEQLIAIGPLSVALDAQLLPFYHSGVFNPGFLCSKTYLDHGRLDVLFFILEIFCFAYLTLNDDRQYILCRYNILIQEKRKCNIKL